MFDISTGDIIRSIMAGGSAAVMAYFWFVRSRNEKPDLRFYQLGSFRGTLRRGNSETPGKRLGFIQLEAGGVLVANHRIRLFSSTVISKIRAVIFEVIGVGATTTNRRGIFRPKPRSPSARLVSLTFRKIMRCPTMCASGWNSSPRVANVFDMRLR